MRRSLILVAALLFTACEGESPVTAPEVDVNPSAALVVTSFNDDFESTPVGTLSGDYALLGGSAEVAEAVQADGTLGHVLEFPSRPGAVEVVGAGQHSDGRVEFDLEPRSGGGAALSVFVRATDPQNGYQVEIHATQMLVSKVVGGTKTVLAHTSTGPGGIWQRFRIQMEGDELRVARADGALLRVTDATFTSGAVLLQADALPIGIDNLLVTTELLPVTAAEPATLPFTTGFDDLTARNGALQHPNLELLAGGVGFLNSVQPDGTTGRVMAFVANSAIKPLMEVVSEPLADGRVEFDLEPCCGGGVALSVFVRATDPQNGYQVEIHATQMLVSKVVGGTKTVLAHTPTGPGGIWQRFRIQMEGDELRVARADGALLRVTDATFTSGAVLLQADALPIHIDNLLVVRLILDPAVLILALIDKVEAFEFKIGIENAMSATLQAALASVENDRPAAIQQLEAFINQVEAFRGNQATDAEADDMIADAEEIIAALQALG